MPAVSVPKAVASSVKSPGLYLVVNLLGGSASPSSGPLRCLIIAPPNSSGFDATVDTEVRQVFGPDDAATMVGSGNPGALAAKRLFQHYGLASVDMIAPTESAGAAATGTQTFTGPATANSTIRLYVMGRVIDVPWLSGESATTFAARAALYVNQYSADLFVTASSSTGDLIYTAKSKGPWGNDVRLNASIIEGGGGIAITVNPAACSGGTTEPDFTTALTNVDTREYAIIIGCLSNADAATASSSSNADRIKTHINSLNTGNAAKLQTCYIGSNGTIANVKAGAVHRNDPVFEYVYGQTFGDLPSEIAGAEVGDTLRFITDQPNFNRIGNKLDLHGPRDTAASKLTAAELEDLLNNGVSPVDIELNTDELFIARPITTHSLNGANPDFRCFDISDTHGAYAVARDLRAATPIEFSNCSISEDLPPNADPLPPNVVEIKDIRAFVLSRLRSIWVKRGVVSGAALQASIDADEFTFEIDSVDPTQVNNVLPLSIIKPLAKIGQVIRKVA
jgi:phage tail sheath gpL-like